MALNLAVTSSIRLSSRSVDIIEVASSGDDDVDTVAMGDGVLPPLNEISIYIIAQQLNFTF